MLNVSVSFETHSQILAGLSPHNQERNWNVAVVSNHSMYVDFRRPFSINIRSLGNNLDSMFSLHYRVVTFVVCSKAILVALTDILPLVMF